MTSNDRIRKYLDAGSVLGQVSRGRAEEIVRELVNAGDIQRGHAEEWVDSLMERSRRTSEQLLETVRREVAAQLGRIDAKTLEHLAGQVADVLKKSAEAGRKTTRDVTTQATRTAAAARTRAGSTAKAARSRASGTATQARAVAEKAIPPRASARRARATKAAAKTTPTRKAAPATSAERAKKASKKAAS